MTGQSGTRQTLPASDLAGPIPTRPQFPVRRWLLALSVLALAYVLAVDARQAWLARNRPRPDQDLAAQLGNRPITSSVLRGLVREEPDWRVIACGDTGPESSPRDVVIEVDYPECYSEQEAARVIRTVWRPLSSALSAQKSSATVRLYVNNAHGQFALAKGVATSQLREAGLEDALVKFTK